MKQRKYHNITMIKRLHEVHITYAKIYIKRRYIK